MSNFWGAHQIGRWRNAIGLLLRIMATIVRLFGGNRKRRGPDPQFNKKSTTIGRWSEGCQKFEIFCGLRMGVV